MTKTSRTMQSKSVVIESPWQQLRALTSARIAIGRSGTSIPTHEMLAFQLDHAKAIDAVHCQLDTNTLVSELQDCPIISSTFLHPPFVTHSQSRDRFTYLQRPDLGRKLCRKDQALLTQYAISTCLDFDLSLVIADGLSSIAVQKHAIPFIQRLSIALKNDDYAWSCSPITIIKQGRVAAGDDIGQALKANMVLVIIGERPGLSSPDSMGLYLTWAPRRGTQDGQRNCISNIRQQGMSYDDACHKALYLAKQARHKQLSGVELKDHSVLTEQLSSAEPCLGQKNFLTHRQNQG